MITKNQLIKKLNDSRITFQLHEHEALFTVKDSEKKRGSIEGIHTKNLFLKNKKKEYFLFSCEENQTVDIKKLSKSNCVDKYLIHNGSKIMLDTIIKKSVNHWYLATCLSLKKPLLKNI